MRNKNLVMFLVIGLITFLGLFGCTQSPSGTNLGNAATISTPGNGNVPNNTINLPANQINAGLTSGTSGPATVGLGAAASFGALGGGAGITNQGLLTVINGDIGTTGVATKITGFRDSAANYTVTPLNNGLVNGRIYTADAANQAVNDARIAFTNLSAASLPGGTDPGAGQLGGLTLTPGIYKANAGSFLITGADLTLDAQGNSNAVFVFQMASSLTVGAPAASRSVNLTNGAQAKNVFWQVGSAATINGAGGGTMVGTIISYASTTFSTAGNAAVVTLNGRALALNASVTMVNTVINVPDTNSFGNQTATGSSGTTAASSVDLGAAATFAGFGGNAGMTNQGLLTVINGNIGTTGVATMMTGFHDSAAGYTVTPLNNGLVNGSIYTADAGKQALADARTAFNNLAALTGGVDPNKNGQLGGLTLTPGIYKAAAGAFLVTGADLTLDAQGNSNAVFVFQMASSLTVGAPAAPRNVNLINGAQAKNVFWQVGSAATINGAGGGTMVGTIISYASTTISTPGNAAVVTLNGRALALNASLTMVNTVINVPGYTSPINNVPIIQTGAGTPQVIGAPANIPLGAAASFGSFGGNAGMTNQGLLTVINGDIGTTGVATMMTGFHDALGTNYTVTSLNNGMVNGRVYTADAGKQALADARTAFDNLAALKDGIDPNNSQLGGMTLIPGIYKSNSGAFLITGKDLTLDARGDANAVFVFQMASSLTVGAPAAPRNVNLINNAQAKNVFWQVGSAATINGAGGGTMVGTIISYAGATFSTAGNTAIVTLNGRALSLNASVTMVNTVINVPGNTTPINNLPAVISTVTAGSTSGNMAPVDLGAAGNFVILSKTGVSTTGTTVIAGNIGVSPIAASAITGFGLIADSSNTFSRSSLATGNIYAADYDAPTPANMTTAVSNMETAYTNAAGRTGPTATELYAGDLSSKTVAPGLYKWSSGVLINGGVTLAGGSNDVWIFQIAQNLTVGNGAIVTLSGGAQAKNIFWQVAGNTTLGTTSNFKGIILCKTNIAMNTGATLTGRALAQTAVTLDATSVTL